VVGDSADYLVGVLVERDRHFTGAGVVEGQGGDAGAFGEPNPPRMDVHFPGVHPAARDQHSPGRIVAVGGVQVDRHVDAGRHAVVAAVGVFRGELRPFVNPAARRVGPHVGGGGPDALDVVERDAELLKLVGAVGEHVRGGDVVGVHRVQLQTLPK
jgi:hypothetical protein